MSRVAESSAGNIILRKQLSPTFLTLIGAILIIFFFHLFKCFSQVLSYFLISLFSYSSLFLINKYHFLCATNINCKLNPVAILLD